MGDELFHADRRADMTKLIVAFRNFANAPKKTFIYTSLSIQRTHIYYMLTKCLSREFLGV